MDAARQVLRFSIPGSVLLLHALAVIVGMQLFQGSSATEATSLIRDNVAPLAGILAAIPLGFLVYQIYYASFGPLLKVGPRWIGWLVRMDRGSQILHVLSDAQLEALRVIFDARLDVALPYERKTGWLKPLRLLELQPAQRDGTRKEVAERYTQRWFENWDVLRAVVDIAGSAASTDQIKREYTTLLDIYHALGASRTAVWLAFAGGSLVTLVRLDDVEASVALTLVGWLSLLAASAALMLVLHVTRGRTWKSAASGLTNSLQWLFVKHPELFEPDEVLTGARPLGLREMLVTRRWRFWVSGIDDPGSGDEPPAA